MNDVCIALKKKEQEEKLYKNYISECLRTIAENTAKEIYYISGGKCEGKYINISLQDVLNPKPVETRASDEIIEDIRNKLRKIGGENT